MTPAQLRTYAETSCSITDLGRANIHQAADDIEALTARIARLESALRDITEYPECSGPYIIASEALEP